MGNHRDGGYIAISRGIFSHAMLHRGRGPFSRMEAWAWLIQEAAWKAEARRLRFGVIHLERGQLAGTIREWGKVWHWAKSNVADFLKRLEAEDMIERGTARVRTNQQPIGRSIGKGAVTIIKICNYDKFQKTSPAKSKRAGQVAGQNTGQLEMAEVVAHDLFGRQTDNHSNHNKTKRATDKSRERMPRHGAQGNGVTFCEYGTDEWRLYASDYRDVIGVDQLPDSYADGKGKWFRTIGAARKHRA